ncbi:TetR/AcrR family transcriptional regulator [Isoptericola sp. NPDC019482]|uniref:TetR/AcrR family transcriptional regulator n=1 Tax=Isoptericola sp. NPDC019482 TaxID=3154688 RepID=UPI003488DCC2
MPSHPSEPRADHRAEHKARTRRAIVDAAAALMDDGGVGFSVDDLAARAGVSRRTVFNHFPSLDDVVAAVGAEVFGAVRGALLAVEPPPVVAAGPDPRPALVADLVGALRRADLVGPMASLTRGLGLQGTSHDAATVPAPQAMLLLKSLSEVGDELTADLARRHPDADPLDVGLAVAQVMSSLVVLHRTWFARTGATTDDEARALWAALLDHLYPGAPVPTPSHVLEGHHG